MKKYLVKEIFGPTIEGEGSQAGAPVLFLRLSGCNRWSGKDEDKSTSICHFCDTDFVGGNRMTSLEIINKLLEKRNRLKEKKEKREEKGKNTRRIDKRIERNQDKINKNPDAIKWKEDAEAKDEGIETVLNDDGTEMTEQQMEEADRKKRKEEAARLL